METYSGMQKAEENKNERWKIAQQQGLSYGQFLELEEVNRQSAEYERIMGINGSEVQE